MDNAGCYRDASLLPGSGTPGCYGDMGQPVTWTPYYHHVNSVNSLFARFLLSVASHKERDHDLEHDGIMQAVGNREDQSGVTSSDHNDSDESEFKSYSDHSIDKILARS